MLLFSFKVAWNFDVQALNVQKFSMGQSQSVFTRANSIDAVENMNAVIKIEYLFN